MVLASGVASMSRAWWLNTEPLALVLLRTYNLFVNLLHTGLYQGDTVELCGCLKSVCCQTDRQLYFMVILFRTRCTHTTLSSPYSYMDDRSTILDLALCLVD